MFRFGYTDRFAYTLSVHSKRLHQIGITLLVAAILVATAGLISRAWYEVASGELHIDAQIFQTVARGMLNGLKPYADLFETKPPGVFLLHAVSLKIFGNQFLVKLLQALVLLGLPILIVVPSVTLVESRGVKHRQITSLLSLLFGVLLALFTANQAGLGLAESYGAFFAVAFLFTLISHPQSSRKRSIILGILLLISVGFKEPFLLTILAGVLLLKKDLLTSFVYPFCIAVALGMVALFVLGIAVPFFQIYLVHMFGFHVQQYHGSTLLRTLEIWRTFINLGAYSWFFSVCITGLWLSVGITSIVNCQLSIVMRFIAASYLMFLAIAIGGDFYGHHFVFAVPVYVVLWWISLQMHADHPKKILVCGFAVTLIGAAFCNVRLSYAMQTQRWNEKEAELIQAAASIDTVMERCEWDRYLQMIVREGGPYAYTKHSPYGPIFVHYSRFIGGNQMYLSEHIRALQESPIILIKDLENSNLTDFAKDYYNVRYAEDAPACAGEDFLQPSPYHLLFRQS